VNDQCQSTKPISSS